MIDSMRFDPPTHRPHGECPISQTSSPRSHRRHIRHRAIALLAVAAIAAAACSDDEPATADADQTVGSIDEPEVVASAAPVTATATASAVTTVSVPESAASASEEEPWSLVVIGDSIPFNSPDDCPGCISFADRYAAAISNATGHPVEVHNLSQHNGLQIDGLLEELETDTGRRDALANADIIVVGIAHNDPPWGRNDDPCDGPNGDIPDWSLYNPTCAAEAAEIFRPKYESVYAQIVALRAGKPTIYRTINRYNDWIGWADPSMTPEAVEATRVVLDAWSPMICNAAQANGFTCADIYHAFNGADGLTSAADLLVADYVHPSDKGNEVIAGVLADLGFAPLAP
jgi:lysophospholipase L1-like esterase